MTFGDDWLTDDSRDVAPPVIGAEDEGREEPLAYVPSRPVSSDDQEVILELRQTIEGRLVVPAYSSLEALVACCGEQQAWVAFRGDMIGQLPETAGAEHLVWDQPLPVDEGSL